MSRRRRSSSNPLGILLIAVLVMTGGYFGKGQSGSMESTDPNAPPGALEYFRGADGASEVVLYRDRIYAHGAGGLLGGEVTINIADISLMKKTGFKVTIHSKDGSYISFDLDLFAVPAARRFKEKLDRLMQEQSGAGGPATN